MSLSVRNHRLLVVLLISEITGVLLAGILSMNHGVLTYMLDDAYIHLVLARSIAAGHYGFNLSEISSPSSSIAWPFLLAPFVWAGMGTIAPFLINFVVLVLTTYLLHRWLTDEMGASGPAASVLTMSIVVGCNVINTVFWGMEHSLQILLVFLVCRGISRIEIGERPAGWAFWMALVAGPLVRYEALAISGVAIVFAAWRTKRVLAPAVAALCIILTVGGFSVFLVSKGLWWLPGSVIEKSDFPLGTMIGLRRLATNFLGNVATQPGILLVSMAALSIAATIRRRDKACYAVIAVIWMLAELMAGQLGWFRRYELWAVTSVCFMAIPACAPIKEWSGSLRPLTLAACAVYALVITSPYLLILGRIPIGASNIYNQQYQMGLLVQRLGVRSIVVNDIGAVGWMNPGVYLFDVVGLASPEVLEHRRCCPDDAKWLEEATDRHGVELILVYDNWVRARPEKWTKIGVLHLADKLVTPAGANVSIYTPNPKAAETLAFRVAAFATSLPPQAQLLLASAHPASP